MMDQKFQKFLDDNYSNPNFAKWNRWIEKYVEPAFIESRHQELVRNFNYISIEKHDFVSQSRIYSELINEIRLDEETRKFIGFLAGAGFFNQWKLSIMDWFNMKNWVNPQINLENRKTINELLEYDKGLNCFKLDLLEMPFWKR